MSHNFDSDWDYLDSLLPKRRPFNEEEEPDDFTD